MGRRVHIFVSDLPRGTKLFASCFPCMRTVPLSALKLYAKYGNGVRLDDIQRRLRCTHCGNKGRALRIVEPPDPRH